jgi:hypothetical protein
VELLVAEGDEHVVADHPVAKLDEPMCGGGRRARPHIVVTNYAPPANAVLVV